MEEVRKKIEEAIKLLFEKDEWLLTQDLSEQSISHKLAVHLQLSFPDYDIDCEYNGSVSSKNGRKKINILKEELEGMGLLKDKERDQLETEYVLRAVFPDIIVHKRKTDEQNLLVIEVKKSTSSVSFDYDYIKLKYYTSETGGNALKYSLGVFIAFETGIAVPTYKLQIYSEGNRIA